MAVVLSRLAVGALLVTHAAAAALDLAIFHMNDDHSHLAGESFELTGVKVPIGLSNVTTSKVKVNYGGYPRLVTFVQGREKQLQSEGMQVLKLHAGDTMTGTSYYSLFKGTADAHMMALLCFDAMSLGNHEFDDGDKNLADFITELHSYDAQCPDTPVVAANVHPGPESPLKGMLSSSITKTLAGEKVGIIGIDIKGKTESSSSPDPGTTLSDEKTSAQAEIDKLKGEGVNKIILLTHIGYDNDLAWMTTLTGVDVVIGADSHTLLGDTDNTGIVGNVAGAYPTMKTNAAGEKMCIFTAWEYAHGIGEIHVSFDDSGVVTSCQGSPKFPFDGTMFTDQDSKALVPADASVVKAYLESKGGQFVAVDEDATTAAALKGYSDKVNTMKTTKIADVPKNICFDRFPGSGKGSLCPPSETQAQGGAVCNLVAQAFLHRAKTADIAIQNGGGCRTDIPAGDFSYDSGYSLLPFSNQMETLVMTGAQIKAVLEDALDFGLNPTGSTGSYPYASGLRFDVDASKAKGSRFTNVEVNSRLAGSWVAISDTASYTVVTNDYISQGKDGYVTFAEAAASAVNLYMEYAQTFIDYATEVKTLVSPPLSMFSTQAYTDKDGVSHGTGARKQAEAATTKMDSVSASTRANTVAALLLLVGVALVQ